MEVVLEMHFFPLSNAHFWFDIKKLTWWSYTATKVLPTTRWIKLIDRSKFAKAALNEKREIFVLYISALEAMTIRPSQVAQIATL